MSELDTSGHGKPAAQQPPIRVDHQLQAPAVPGQPRPGSRAWIGWVVGAVVLIGLFGVFERRNRTASAAAAAKTNAGPPVVEIAMTNAWKGDIGAFVPGLGIVTPVYTVSVKSRVDGQLMAVKYTEGQLVKAGDPLLEIDPRPYQALLTAAEGQRARDGALLENAKVDLTRYQEAFASNAIPKQQLDTQGWLVHQDEGTVQFDQGQVESAKVNLAYCNITSPITGRVGLRLVDPGNIVHAADTTPLVIVAQLQPITVVFTVAEDNLPRILKRMRMKEPMVVDALDRAQKEKLASGTVLTLDNQVDTGSGTIKIKAIFTNADEVLFPNQFVNARLLVETDHDAVLVPTQAIQRNPQGPFVYVVKPDQTATMRAVKAGTRDGDVTAVTGLNAGEQIATDNFNRLQEGAKVAQRKSAGAGGRGGRGGRGGGGGGRRGGSGSQEPRSP